MSSPDAGPRGCTVDVRRCGGGRTLPVSVVTVGGDVDVATVARLDRALQTATGDDIRHVVVDLAAVTFLDSTGLRTLLHHAQGFDERGGVLTCTHLSRPARRTMEITGLVGYLTRPLSNTAE